MGASHTVVSLADIWESDIWESREAKMDVWAAAEVPCTVNKPCGDSEEK